MTEEIFDIVDENGQPAGGAVTRSQAHAEGIRHRTAHIWVVRKNGCKNIRLACRKEMRSFACRWAGLR